MLIVTAVLAVVGTVTLTGAPVVHVGGFALVGVGAAVLVLLSLIVVGARRGQRGAERTGPPPDESTAGRGAFAEPELDREFAREERLTAKDMLGVDVPHEEAAASLNGYHHHLREHHGRRRGGRFHFMQRGREPGSA